MCEANAYLIKDGREQLPMASVDVVEPEEKGTWRLVGIFGDQKIVNAKIKGLKLVDHKILFEPLSD
jgi:predicted RNA-binding protein